MKEYQFHKKWGEKCQVPSEAIEYAYALIEEPVKQMEYLQYLTKVTEWWDDNDIESIPMHIRRQCKTGERREKAEQTYKKYLSEHIRGVKRRNPLSNRQAKNKTKLQQWFFHGRKTGRALSRAKGIGYFQSYMQQKYIRPKGRPVFLAWYLHHLIDYCHEVHETFKLDEIIERNEARIKPIYPSDYNEIVSFIQRNWEELKHDLES